MEIDHKREHHLGPDGELILSCGCGYPVQQGAFSRLVRSYDIPADVWLVLH